MSFISKVVWILVIVILFLFVSYLASKIMVGVLNQRLNKIQINIDTSTSQKKKEDVGEEEGVIESFMGKPKRKYYEIKNNDLCEGFDNSDKGFKPL